MTTSRTDLITNRIKEALNGVRVQTSELYHESTEVASFGAVKTVMFFWNVADNDLTAEMVEREILVRLQAENIYVAFHKTRRREGERLVAASIPCNPNNPNYTYGNLRGFTQMWLQKSFGATKDRLQQKQRDSNLFIRR